MPFFFSLLSLFFPPACILRSLTLLSRLVLFLRVLVFIATADLLTSRSALLVFLVGHIDLFREAKFSCSCQTSELSAISQ